LDHRNNIASLGMDRVFELLDGDFRVRDFHRDSLVVERADEQLNGHDEKWLWLWQLLSKPKCQDDIWERTVLI
jgi:hypothetical protein